MKVIIFGASGATGRLTVKKAVQAGHEVTAFVRSRARLMETASLKGLEVVEGNVLDISQVKDALAGQDAVIVALGAPGRNKSGIREKGTETIIQGMQSQGLRRLVCLSTMGIADTRHMPPWMFRNIIVPLFIKDAFRDHEKQEQKVRASGLDWTLIRPPNLTDEQARGSFHVGFPREWDELVDKISREDVASALVEQLEDETSWNKAPTVYYPAA
ncbi:MAG: epimerase [Spirochaetaceae bacterium]|nr:epimerase [Spirochaetaceae bacterium]|tara:strand:- start:44044 stop:44688 length:645 start_codon:yes stop_codon:yes gene_type:complete